METPPRTQQQLEGLFDDEGRQSTAQPAFAPTSPHTASSKVVVEQLASLMDGHPTSAKYVFIPCADFNPAVYRGIAEAERHGFVLVEPVESITLCTNIYSFSLRISCFMRISAHCGLILLLSTLASES